MSDQKSDHWSSNFQRLRTETFLLSLLLFCFSRLPIEIKRIPIVGVDLSASISAGPIQLFLLGAWAYFVVAWGVRYRLERSDSSFHEERVLEFVPSLQNLRGRVNELALPDLAPAFAELKDFERKLNGFMDFEQNYQANAQIVEKLQKAIEDHNIGDARLKNEIEDVQHRLELRRESLKDIQLAVGEVHTVVQSVFSEIKQTLDYAGTRLPSAIENFNTTADKVSKRMAGFRSSLAWDRQWLGFALPLFFSVVLVLLALPQVVVDSGPLLDDAASCLADPQWKCLLRTELGTDDY